MTKWRFWYNSLIGRKNLIKKKFTYCEKYHNLFDWISSISS
jgi:hypothetical protein